MKITHVKTQIIRLPAVEPLADGPVAAGASRDIVTLTLGTDAGIEGIGLTYYGGCFGGPAIASLKAMVDQLAARIVGEDPLRGEAVLAKLRALGGNLGPGGVMAHAVAAIDIALWDIKGKASNLSLAQMVGGHRDRRTDAFLHTRTLSEGGTGAGCARFSPDENAAWPAWQQKSGTRG